MTFDEWIYKVCELAQIRSRKEITDIYSLVDLTDAKLSYMEGVSPEDYNI